MGDFLDATATGDYISDTLLPDNGSTNDPVIVLQDALKANGLVVAQGGNLFLYGKSMGTSWDRLSTSVAGGDTSLTLPGSTATWEVGQEMVLASSDYAWTSGAMDRTQSEVLSITARDINDPNKLYFTASTGAGLVYGHHAAVESFDPAGGGSSAWDVEERAEVGLLSRKIKILGISNPATAGHQGHVFFHRLPGQAAPRIEVQWAEFKGLGNAGELARYPVHFHMLGDVNPPPNQLFIKNCSVRDSVNNGIVVHATQDVLVQRNVVHDVDGYGIYLEQDDPAMPTIGNQVLENLVLVNSLPTIPLPSSPATDQDPANYAIRNLRNDIRGNVAAESRGSGFYLKLDADLAPTSYAGMTFEGNEAHSSGTIGIYQNAEIRPTGALQFTDTLVWKCREYGMWIRCLGSCVVSDLVAADCRSGYYPATLGVRGAGEGDHFLTNALLVGMTSNIGNVDPANSYEGTAGRSLPQNQPMTPSNRALMWDTLNGVEMYDGLIEIADSRFAAFQDFLFDSTNGPRLAAGLTQVAKLSTWGNDPRNRVSGLTFYDNPASAAKMVARTAYFRPVDAGQNQIAFTLIVDEDGSLGYGANVALLPNDPYLVAHRAPPNLTFHSLLNGYSVPLSTAGYGQVVLEIDDDIPPPDFDDEWSQTEWVRVQDPAGTTPVLGAAWVADSTTTDPSGGGHNEFVFPVSTEVGLANLPAAQVRYYRIRYPNLLTLSTPKNFNFAFRFAPLENTVVFLEIPYSGGNGSGGGPSNIPTYEGTAGGGGTLAILSSLQNLISSGSSVPQAYFFDASQGILYLKITAIVQGGQEPIPFGTETIVRIKNS